MVHFWIQDLKAKSKLKRRAQSAIKILFALQHQNDENQITNVMMKVNLISKLQSQKGELNVFTLLRIANSNDKC